MKCKQCAGKSKVIRTKKRPSGVVLRERMCLQCSHRWTTKEAQVEERLVYVEG